jgi:anti-sigma factor RsiW
MGQRPSDEELMQWLDAELGEPRRDEVTSWLEAEEELRSKLAAMGTVGDLLRDGVDGDERGDAIADAVMAKLVTEPDKTRDAEVVSLGSRRFRHYGHAEPANQNARTIFWMAGVAAAVAFGLFFWSRMGIQELSVASGTSERSGDARSSAEVAPGDSSLEPKWISSGPAAAEREEDSGPAVEVAAVDFGSHSGSVFYVSAGHGELGATTAVVWVTEDVGGK